MHGKIKELSLREKAKLVSGASFWRTQEVERVGIRSAVLTDGPHGVRFQKEGADALGILDSIEATSFPTASATGSTWDPDLIEEMGRALGVEARALGVDILLGPGVNIKRSPLCGRNFEYLSEDPLLAGALGSAWVRGVQSQGVGASVKHFAANNQETDRMRVSAEVDERTLREIYLPAFERIVRDAEPATVMCSYNRINGVHASQNRWLLTETLREEWGFSGYVVSDWGAVVDPVAALEAGLDLEMPSTGERSPDLIEQAVLAGTLSEETLDSAVSRVLAVHDRLRKDTVAGPPDLEAHHQLARRIAAESAVLLANDDKILPVDPVRGGSIAVIGEFARNPRFQGSGSSHIVPTRLDDALTAIRATSQRDVGFAPGFSLGDEQDQNLHDEAVALAQKSETVLLFLGLPDAAESEGFDRDHLYLPTAQLDLFTAIIEKNPRTVVILSNGGVVGLEGIRGAAPGILEMWLGGQASGTAAADVIFGVAEPGGRLAETMPVALAHTPAHVNWPGSAGIVRYGEGTFVGYRWYDATDRDVAYPFGFGLGYTSFAYSDLSVTVPDSATAEAVVELTIENTGTRSGSDVVQIYVGDDEASVPRAPRELKGFKKVRLDAGEKQRVRVHLDERAFAYWYANKWTVDPGNFTIHAGSSSRDLPLRQTIELEVEAVPPALERSSSVGEWFAHPLGRPVVETLLNGMAAEAAGPPDGETFKMMAAMPLRTLLGFIQGATGEPVDSDAAITALLEQVAVGESR